MKGKKVVIILLFLCFFISLTSVSASADVNITNDDYNNNLESVNENTRILSSNVKSIDELNTEIQNSKPDSTIKLENDYVISNETAIDGIDIYNNITIDGQGHFIDGNYSNMDYLFRIHEDNVVLKNIKFTNLETLFSYNTIEWMGNYGKIINCTFINNYAYYGGSVDWTGIYGQITNCTFINNTAENGGALYCYGNYCTLTNCTFINNYASEGGAIYISGRDTWVNRCSFDNNTADNGGAIYWENIYGNLTTSVFTNNYADCGGAVYTSSFKSDIISCDFFNNIAEDTAGAIYWSVNGGNILSCAFKNNNASTAGAIYGDKGDDIFINNSAFLNNSAEELGGALFIEDDGIIENSEFANNTAKLGGAIYSDSQSTILNSTFISNSAENGGAVAINDGEIINSTFIGNSASGSAGAVMCAGEVLVNGTSFNKNSADDGSNNIVLMDASNITIGNVTSDSPLNYKIINMTVTSENVTYGELLKIDVNLNHKLNDGQLYILLNNQLYSFNVTNGTVNATFSNLNAGNYAFNIFYNCSDYSTQEEQITLSVLKKNISITANKATSTINYAKKYSITLKDGNGKALNGEKIFFYINNKQIGTATTKNGVATITISAKTLKSFKSGTKTLKVTLNNKNYNPSSKTAKIVINKEKTKLVAGKKTFKKSVKTKKYTATLKNSKGKVLKKVKVTLKVKGKTYKAKTNSKGKATFKINKLNKKGKFTATIKYSGNAYYKAVTKKVKITIR